MAIILPILAPLVRELHLTESQAGWMVSIGSLFMAGAAPLWGRFSDTRGRKAVLLWGFTGIFVSYVAYTATVWAGLTGVLAGSVLFLVLVATRSGIGVFLATPMTGAQALIADNTSEEDRSSGMAIISAGSGIGLVLGPGIGGILAINGLIWPLIATTVLGLVGAVYVGLALPKAQPRQKTTNTSKGALTRHTAPWLVIGIIAMCGIVTVQICAGFYIQDSLALETFEVAPILAIALTSVGIAMLVTQIVQIKLLRWSSRMMVTIGPIIWILGTVLLLSTSDVLAYYLAYALMGIGVGFLMPGYVSGASLAAHADHQGSVSGLSAAAQGIAGVIGPVASTTLYGFGIALPFEAIMGLMVLVIIGAVLLPKNPVTPVNPNLTEEQLIMTSSTDET